jgi:hypothetical protein
VSTALPQSDGRQVEIHIKGRDLRQGHTKEVVLTPADLAEALTLPVAEMAEFICRALEDLPPQVAADERGAGLDLDALGTRLADRQVVAATHVADDRLVHGVAGTAQRLRGQDVAAPQHGDVGRAAADVDHHGGSGPEHELGAERGRHRLGDEKDLARAERHRGVVDGFALDLRSSGRHADQDARAAEAQAALRALDEMAQHRLSSHEVGDDAVAQRPHHLEAFRRPSDECYGLAADRQDLAFAAMGAHGDNGRFIDDDAAADHVHERVGRAEVDRNVF